MSYYFFQCQFSIFISKTIIQVTFGMAFLWPNRRHCLPQKFSCSLIYFSQVKKNVQGQFDLFQSRYKSFLEEYEAKELLRLTSYGSPQTNISQVCLDPQVIILKMIQYTIFDFLGSVLERPQCSNLISCLMNQICLEP
jgi:hypothetical protein